MPLRKKPFSPKQHLKILRLSIIGVAVFIFFFSLLFKMTQYINMFWAITAALFVGGSGAVIIGGLYWKRGTTAAAWSAMIAGAVISIVGIVILYFDESFFINGQWFYFLSMVGAIATYVFVSLLGKKNAFNLDKLLHRGEYAIEGEHEIIETQPMKGLKMLGMGKEFTRGDKIIYIATYAWIISWILVFLVGTIYYLTVGFSDDGWMKFWYVFLWINLAAMIIITLWFGIGGIKDIKSMFKSLKTMERDDKDDGFVSE